MEPEEVGSSALAEAFQALGSDVRVRILKELLQGVRDTSELIRATGLRSGSVRYHLNILIAEGLVERFTRHQEGDVGRPPIRYRLRPAGITQGIPFRQYRLLSEVLLGVIRESLPPDEQDRALYAAGKQVGQQLIDGVAGEADVGEWDPELFVRVFLQDALPRMGSLTTVMDQTEGFVRYRLMTCPFQELALKRPSMICDSFDTGFHEGVAEKLGSQVRHKRLACIGHGDPYCEYALRWEEAEGAS
ncbi:MAG: helix-turn-helix transcriptional regulator [Thermoplasmata archaeon]